MKNGLPCNGRPFFTVLFFMRLSALLFNLRFLDPGDDKHSCDK